MKAAQLTLALPELPPADCSDLDFAAGERELAAQERRKTAKAARARRCRCRRPFVDDDGDCVLCGREVRLAWAEEGER